MENELIEFYVSPELKRRMELVAAKRNMTVEDYCLAALKGRLARDGENIEDAFTHRS